MFYAIVRLSFCFGGLVSFFVSGRKGWVEYSAHLLWHLHLVTTTVNNMLKICGPPLYMPHSLSCTVPLTVNELLKELSVSREKACVI